MREPPAPPSEEMAPKPPYANWPRWWARLSSRRQDRIVALAPLIAVFLFFGITSLAFWFISSEEKSREQIVARQSIESIQQHIRLRLIGSEDAIQGFGADLNRYSEPAKGLTNIGSVFLNSHPEIMCLYWHDLQSGQVYGLHPNEDPTVPESIKSITLEDIQSSIDTQHSPKSPPAFRLQ